MSYSGYHGFTSEAAFNAALDRHITGNWGENQVQEEEPETNEDAEYEKYIDDMMEGRITKRRLYR